MPSGPRHTASISAGPGRQVATTSHSAASAAGEADHTAPESSSAAAAARRKSWTTRAWPAASSCKAIGAPILPTPMKPIFMSSALLGIGDRRAARHLLHELAQHRVGKAVEPLGHHDKRRRAADHIAVVVFLEPRLLAEDRQTVDRDPGFDELVAHG